MNKLIILLSVVIVNVSTVVNSQTVEWLDFSLYSGSGTVLSHPLLGDVRVTTDFEPQATFAGSAGSLNDLSWGEFNYINYDGSSTGTKSSITATMTFDFIDGAIDTGITSLFFSSNGLAAGSSYTVNNSPAFLGEIAVGEGSGSRTTLAGGLLKINGFGFNHTPDLYVLGEDSISSFVVNVNQINGDGTGFALGAATIPEPSTYALILTILIGFEAVRRKIK